MSMTFQSSFPPIDILIVEDSLTQAQRLKHLLEKHGYLVTHAANGRLALDAARKSKPTLIISDIIMPEMDGYELCQAVKADAALSHVPVILVTALSDPGDVIRGLECRADNFILKPYDERYLLSRIQYVLLNIEVQEAQHAALGVEIFFNGKRHFITADRLQILNLLLSTYDAAIQRNKELSRAKEDLHALNERLEYANKELESFSYSVSHDLRTPLRHIEGFTGLLKRRIAGSVDPTSLELMTHIETAGKTMNRLIDDLLAFSRMTRADMQTSTVDPNPMIQEILREMETDLLGRQIDWRIATLPTVQADPAMLKQVLTNLISNAVKYTRNRTPAEITINSVEEQEGCVTISVRDNGAGFDMQYAHKLFGVFQRLHAANEFEGTGIGLATVQRIILRHGGRVWAEGILDKGATFSFTLKCSQTISQ